MVKNQILSVPVYDRVKRGYTSFLDILDIVAFAVKPIMNESKTSIDSQGKVEGNQNTEGNGKKEGENGIPKELQDCFTAPVFETVTCGEIADFSGRSMQ